MALVLRNTKGSALTYSELDGNFTFITSSFVQNNLTSSMTAGTASYVTGKAYPAGSPIDQSFKIIAGNDVTDPNGFKIIDFSTQLLGKTLGLDCFVTATVSGSDHSTINIVNMPSPGNIAFTSSVVSSYFNYQIMYY
jgi:hypothetical protein